MVRSANQDSDVWDRVVELTSANVSPILRPTYLPDGIDTVTLLAPAGPNYIFRVEYTGSGLRLVVEASQYNLSPPRTSDHQELVRLRDVPCNTGEKPWGCFWQTSDPASPTAQMWLAWSEPGIWQMADQPLRQLTPGEPTRVVPGPTQDYVQYLLSAEGLRREEVSAVAEGLTLATAPR